MRKTRKNMGFTMAELLVVVAIIVILSGVGFIAVQRYQRSLAQLERNTIAKEIFIAAQNHLTMADSEGYLSDTVDFGTPDDTASEENVYCAANGSSTGILELILPFGSIDETVRFGGSYLIHYQTNPARVLNVYYCTTSGTPERFNKDSKIKSTELSTLEEKRTSSSGSGYVLGYYGGEEALANGDIIIAPTVEVINAERLIVKVTDNNFTNSNAALKLIITGEGTNESDASNAKLAITLTTASQSSNGRFYNNDKEYTVVLDDITTPSATSPYDTSINDGLHFADLNKFASSSSPDKVLQFMQNDGGTIPTFLPGENITVQAVAYSNTALTNIAYSSARTTNSLFADPGDSDTTTMIANFRHLENLDALVSGLHPTLGYTSAEQIADLVWDETLAADSEAFCNVITDASIYKLGAATGTTPRCYLPIISSAADVNGGTPNPIALTYEGHNHSITSVKVDNADDSGLFASLTTGSSVSNLKLVDFSITTSSGNAGALVGTLNQASALATDKNNVSNVLAYNSTGATSVNVASTGDTSATLGNAGGLIGEMTGSYGKVKNSAAALIVSSTGGDAGGLIGKADSETITGCYSGGHTIDDPNGTGAVIYSSSNYNVTAAAGNAGGLVGDAGSTSINSSYSTCSATGTTAGGFVGTGNGNYTKCYATGLVGGTTVGAFTGNSAYSGTANKCHYFEIINKFTNATTGSYDYLTAIPKTGTGDGTYSDITAFDVSAEDYNNFTGAQSDWKTATPYIPTGKTASTLSTYYKKTVNGIEVTLYPFKTVEQIDASITATDLVSTHYGDWPAPEIFVLNTAS